MIWPLPVERNLSTKNLQGQSQSQSKGQSQSKSKSEGQSQSQPQSQSQSQSQRNRNRNRSLTRCRSQRQCLCGRQGPESFQRIHMKRRHRGVTVPELMMVLAVAAVLLMLGLPDLRAMIARQQLRAAANDLFAGIDLTRSHAIARGRRVLMVPAGAGQDDWLQGWTVFVDKNANLRPDAGDDVIFSRGKLARGIAIHSNFAVAGGLDYIAYNGAGRSCSASNVQVSRPGTLSMVLGQNTRHITINMLGRARICDPARLSRGCSGLADP